MDLIGIEEQITFCQSSLGVLFEGFYAEKIYTEKELKKMLSKVEDGYSKEQINLFIIKRCMKDNLNIEIEFEKFLFATEFKSFADKFLVTKNEMQKIFEEIQKEKHDEFYQSPKVKKIILDVRGELPIISARIYNISLGLFTKADGSEITIKEYSELCQEDLKTNLKILESAKRIVDQKVKRRLGKENV